MTKCGQIYGFFFFYHGLNSVVNNIYFCTWKEQRKKKKLCQVREREIEIQIGWANSMNCKCSSCICILKALLDCRVNFSQLSIRFYLFESHMDFVICVLYWTKSVWKQYIFCIWNCRLPVVGWRSAKVVPKSLSDIVFYVLSSFIYIEIFIYLITICYMHMHMGIRFHFCHNNMFFYISIIVQLLCLNIVFDNISTTNKTSKINDTTCPRKFSC